MVSRFTVRDSDEEQELAQDVPKLLSLAGAPVNRV